MNNYDPFVIPFIAGLIILLIILLIKYFNWLKDLTGSEWRKVIKGILSHKLLLGIQECFFECLIHRKIFRQNFKLGYMHMSFAFGWFLLIIVGALESKFHTGGAIKPPYYPVFFKFFVHDKASIEYAGTFIFLMDFLLLFILSGLVVAVIKRINSSYVGMKKTTKFGFGNKLTIGSLWLIFPLRLLAESSTAAVYHNGGFLTNNVGKLLSVFLPVSMVEYPLWWAYSIVLGIFFVSVPYSRYMHIPTEVLLIFLRRFGIKNKKYFDGFSLIELNACPRCGLCIDICQLNTVFENEKVTPSYFLKSIRDGKVNDSLVFDCMLCGRCKEFCPVGIDTLYQRMLQREKHINSNNINFKYLNNKNNVQQIENIKQVDVLYFAGCMTHLTPGIKKAVVSILEKAGINYDFLDKDGGACCGRPQTMSGAFKMAEELIVYNTERIKNSGAKVLLCSCPICYRVFKEDYKLDIIIMHHSEYINLLIKANRLSLKDKTNLTAIYHDPCELGRAFKIYKEPRLIINKIVNLQKIKDEKKRSLCCGGSIGILDIANEERKKITELTVKTLTADNPDYIITSCPLCKKTFSNTTDVKVLDITELINNNS